MLKKLCKKICPKKSTREIVIVFPFDIESKRLLIIDEYIHHYQKSFWKYVSGGIDKENTDIKTHAVEELAEEMKMGAASWHHIYTAEKIFGNRGSHFYIAENPYLLDHPPENPDVDEIIGSRWVNYTEFVEMIDRQELLWDQATMVALQVFRRYQDN